MVVKRLYREVKVVISNLSQVKAIPGINAGLHIDIKLEKFKDVTRHLIPGGKKDT